MSNIFQSISINPQRKEISVENQIQKRKGKRLERGVQKLTMQMIPLMMKYFSKLIAQVTSQKQLQV